MDGGLLVPSPKGDWTMISLGLAASPTAADVAAFFER
jgi:hypothetical protein